MSELNGLVKHLARKVGFELAGIAKPEPPPESEFFEIWLKNGYAASMDYLSNRLSERLVPERLLPNVSSMIVCGLLYNTRDSLSINFSEPSRLWISRYAWGDDYHLIVKKNLQLLNELLTKELNRSFQSKIYVDTGPVLEKVYAYRAGLGWFGKNSCLLNKRFGSYFFLGVMLTDLEIEADSPGSEHCGKCTRCLDACPTGAIVEPRVVDSRRCISYQSIENRQEIPLSLRRKMGKNIFGCDICQEVCPWNRGKPKSKIEGFQPREHFFKPAVLDLFKKVNVDYPTGFARSPLKRAKRTGLLKNLIIAIVNNREKRYISMLNSIDTEKNQQIKKLINWAISELEKV